MSQTGTARRRRVFLQVAYESIHLFRRHFGQIPMSMMLMQVFSHMAQSRDRFVAECGSAAEFVLDLKGNPLSGFIVS